MWKIENLRKHSFACPPALSRLKETNDRDRDRERERAEEHLEENIITPMSFSVFRCRCMLSFNQCSIVLFISIFFIANQNTIAQASIQHAVVLVYSTISNIFRFAFFSTVSMKSDLDIGCITSTIHMTSLLFWSNYFKHFMI